MLSAYSFRPRLWALLLAAAACAAGIALGNWQARRAEEKRVIGEQLDRAAKSPPIELRAEARDARALVSRRVAASGRFLEEHTVLLDNKLRRGRPGYEVVTPLKLNGMHVLVNRGWLEAGRTREAVPSVRTPSGEVRITGLALAQLPQALAAGPQEKGKVRQNLAVAAYGAQTGLALLPIVVEQHSDSGDGLLREWPRPDAGIEKHQSYSLQWYSLAALAVILFVVLSFRRVGTR